MSRPELSSRLPAPLHGPASFVLAHQGIFVRILAIIVALIVWEWYASTNPPYVFPELSAISDAFIEQYQEDELVPRFFESMRTLFLGYILAVLVAIPIGLLMGISRPAEVILDPYVTALYVAPVVALVPLFIFVGGATFQTRVAIVFIFAFFEPLINTYKGAKATPDELISIARSFGGNRLFILRHVVIPYDLPYIFAGLRLGIGRAIKGLVLSEILISFAGLGGILRSWEDSFRIAGVLSIAILFMVVGFVLTKSMQRTEERLFDWRPQEADE